MRTFFVFNSDNHMWLFTAPNGKIFHAGPSKTTHYLSLNGQGSVTAKAVRGNDDTMVGNAVMYDVGKILTLGGSANYDNSPGVNAAHIITLDATGATDDVTIEQVGSLVHGRTMSNAVVLPNGQVVVVGGMEVGKVFSLEGAIYEAELFDPVTKQFTEMQRPYCCPTVVSGPAVAVIVPLNPARRDRRPTSSIAKSTPRPTSSTPSRTS
jgi:galactose oxidase